MGISGVETAVGPNLVLSATATSATSTTGATFSGLIGSTARLVGGLAYPLTGAAAGDYQRIRTFNSGTGAMTWDAMAHDPSTVAFAIVPSDDTDIKAIKTKTDIIPLRVAKLHASITAATVAAFNYTGRIGIVNLGATVVNAAIANTSCTVKYNFVADSLAGVDLCAVSADIKQFVRGTLLGPITGTPADALPGVTGVAGRASQAIVIEVGCETSGVINAIYSGAPATGQLLHDICWLPLSPGATLVAA